jgi:radical SAM protein with 4Fe4S-binding SPASM domain
MKRMGYNLDRVVLELTDKQHGEYRFGRPLPGVPIGDIGPNIWSAAAPMIEGVKHITLGVGEPLLCNSFKKHLRTVHSLAPDAPIQIDTDGILLSKWAHVCMMYGVKLIRFPFDTLDGNLYKKLTKGLDHSKLIESVQYSVRLNREQGNPIRFKALCHVCEENLTELSDLMLFFHQYRIQEVELYLKTGPAPDVLKKIAKAKKDAQGLGIIIEDKRRTPVTVDAYCKAAYDTVYVRASGEVMPCLEFKENFGSLITQTAQEILDSTRREALQSCVGACEVDWACAECPLVGSFHVGRMRGDG